MRRESDTSLEKHRRKYATAICQARRVGDDAFQAWFNREAAHNTHQCIVRGYWDFTLHILTPTVCQYITSPEDKIALEIGYGGGRMLNAACSYFKEAIGIDIHEEQETVAAFLRAQQKTNFRLLCTSGASIDVASDSVDFIYSFIVLQHLPTFSVFVHYVREVQRCLKPGGVAQLYFGRFSRLHPLYQLYFLGRGYKETHGVPANHISLVVRTGKVKRVCQAIGLRVVDSGTSYFCAPDGYPRRAGGQNYCTVYKSGNT